MKYSTVLGKKISKMSLGTVQFGLHYGIANDVGKPAESQSADMMRYALNNGVTSIDTARAYGDSEEIIGRFFNDYDGETPFVSTKVPPYQNIDDLAGLEKHIIGNVETSLQHLGLSKVDNIMLHNGVSLTINGDRTAQIMGDLIKRGYCDMVGASVYNAAEIDKMLSYEQYTVTQIPMSIFDQRLINTGYVDKLAKKGYTVFVRSVFLQGLFFLDPHKITDPILLEHAYPGILKLRDLAEKEGMSIAEMAISFLRDYPGVTSLVLGSDNVDQVSANIHYFDAHPLSEETNSILKETFADVNIPEIMKVLSRPK